MNDGKKPLPHHSPNQVDHVMQFFTYVHLPPAMQEISKPFCDLAQWMVTTLPRNQQRTIALNNLLASKDAAVRASIAKD